jgi:flagellar biosynthesis/type III secretory pathway ATPase
MEAALAPNPGTSVTLQTQIGDRGREVRRRISRRMGLQGKWTVIC